MTEFSVLMIIRLHKKWCRNREDYNAQEIGLSVIFSPNSASHVFSASFIVVEVRGGGTARKYCLCIISSNVVTLKDRLYH